MKKKFLAAAVGAMLVGSSAMAVELAHGGKGDWLIAPMYMAVGGWNTEFKVINTSTTDSAVAKVVFHAAGNSAELRDFLIYLSPGDVWTGELSEAGGVVTFKSSEESSYTVPAMSNSCQASTGTPGITTALNGTNGIASFGYVNIIQTKMIRGLPRNADGTVSKAAIIKKYSEDCTAVAPIETDNVLTGSVKLFNAQNGNRLLLPMTALQNYENRRYHNVVEYTGFFNNKLAGTVTANKAEVEDALWSRDFVVPFNVGGAQSTFATVTFPTKEAFNAPSRSGSQYSPFPGSVPVGYTVRDEAELTFQSVGCTFSPCPQDQTYALVNEMNVISMAPGRSSGTEIDTKTFGKGWVNINLESEMSDTASNPAWNSVNQTGAPAIATYIQWEYSTIPQVAGNANFGTQLQGTWAYAPANYPVGIPAAASVR